MDDTSGFYKLADGGLLFAPNFVHAPGGVALSRDNPDDHAGMHSGWQWFDSDAAAYAFHNITPSSPPGETISPLQARLELLAAGKLDAVEALVSQADRATQLAWAQATEFKRSSPLLNTMAQAVGIDAATLDNMFASARLREV